LLKEAYEHMDVLNLYPIVQLTCNYNNGIAITLSVQMVAVYDFLSSEVGH
jgi:hypothetical protein